ncbi:hypothetical protein K501DRAFT_331179 [Backusella circina FSU 941]|nr:hypothetical protein K501DRAFT_331179 [Backusella circina FSU 941]
MSQHHSPTDAAKLPVVIDEDEPTMSVVHVTVTEAGTVVYTQTATSYSYIPSYSAVHPTSTSTSISQDGSNVTSSPGSEDDSSGSKGALIGGIAGGVGGFIVLALIVFLLVRRSRLKKKNQHNAGNDFTTSPISRPMYEGEEIGPYYYDPNEAVQGYYEDRLSVHHHGGYSKYPSMNHHPARQSMVAESMNSTLAPTVTAVMGQVPNEIERNVPHLKENEPPHSK